MSAVHSACCAGMPMAYARLGVNDKRTYVEDGTSSLMKRHRQDAGPITATRRRVDGCPDGPGSH